MFHPCVENISFPVYETGARVRDFFPPRTGCCRRLLAGFARRGSEDEGAPGLEWVQSRETSRWTTELCCGVGYSCTAIGCRRHTQPAKIDMSKCGTIVGALACQRDSYMRTLRTTVLSCTPVATTQPDEGKNKKKKKKQDQDNEEPSVPLYEVELADTVLFPEGGGQPADHGVIRPDSEPEREVAVVDVQRRGLRAVHVVDGPLAEAAPVEVSLDWRRRVDHMQQHTGQHLLSAVLDRHGLPTLGWSMGARINYVDVPRRLSDEELAQVAEEVNDEIFRNTPITVDAGDNVEVDAEVEVDPEKGLLRVVRIGELDRNPCCGTHLSSTGQVQAVALLGQGRGKNKAARLSFTCGGRMHKYAAELHETTARVGATLSSSVEELDARAGQLVQQCRRLQHREKALNKELAQLHAAELLRGDPHGPLTLYRADGDLEFLNNVCGAVKEQRGDGDGTLVLIAGTDGAVVVTGPSEQATGDAVAALREKLPQLRGGGRGTRFQGKLVGGTPSEAELEALLAQLTLGSG